MMLLMLATRSMQSIPTHTANIRKWWFAGASPSAWNVKAHIPIRIVIIISFFINTIIMVARPKYILTYNYHHFYNHTGHINENYWCFFRNIFGKIVSTRNTQHLSFQKAPSPTKRGDLALFSCIFSFVKYFVTVF